MNQATSHERLVPFDVRNTPFQRHVCIVYSQPGDKELRDRIARAICDANMTVYEDDETISPAENISTGIDCSLKTLILVTKNFVRDGSWTDVVRLVQEYMQSISPDVVLVARAPDITNHDLQSVGVASFPNVALTEDSYTSLVNLIAGRLCMPTSMRPNMGWTMAVCYYHGYLSIILPGLKERIKKSGFMGEPSVLQNMNGRDMSHKFFIIIPSSLKCLPRLSEFDSTITDYGKVLFKVSRGGLPERDYSSYVHKIQYQDHKTPKKYMFLGEVPAVLLNMFDMNEDPATACDGDPRVRNREVQQFYLYLLQFLQNNTQCKGKYSFIFHQDESLHSYQPIGDLIRASVEDEIWNEMKEGVSHNVEELDVQPMEVDSVGDNTDVGRETLRAEESRIKAQYLSAPDKFYSLTVDKKNKQGRALVINNRDFKGNRLQPRRGAEKDEAKVHHLLDVVLNFDVDVRRDLTAEQMKRVVHQYAKDQNHSASRVAICVIMTHGECGQLYGTDAEPVSIVKLLEMIGQSEHLRGKPKLIFIEACQSVDPSDCSSVDPDSVMTDDSDTRTRLTPSAADILASFSTVPGRRAYRSPTTGTLYIQALCSIIREYRRGKTLEQMLHMVAERVQQAAENDQPSSRGDIVPRQRPFFINALTKNVLLD